MTKKNLKDILEGIEVKSIDGPLNISISGVATDSKLMKEDFIFVAVKGTIYDGHDFIKEAIEKGASAVIAQEDFCLPITKIIVPDSRKAQAIVAHNFYDRPASKLRIVGITGTNGKTTVSYLIESILKEAGLSVGVVGTINYRYGLRQIPSTNTTPGSLLLVEMLHYMVINNAEYVVMEVSSHSLEQQRIFGIDFKTAVFTNVTPEHLDYHKDLAEYKKVKAMLFEGLSKSSTAIVNIDDDFGKELTNRVKSAVLTYGLGKDVQIRSERLSLSLTGTSLIVNTPNGKLKIYSKLVGKFNVYNILASVASGIAEGIDSSKIIAGIEALKFVPGRFQEISLGQPFKVYVDYAHTDEALKNILTTLRELTSSRIITLFGCGGDRDATKRPRMAKVASEFSDYVVITTDNPRSEDPQSITEQIARGIIKKRLKNSFIILDREAAIKKAMSLAAEGDIVLLAGKGHETYQIFKNRYEPFDDREIAKKALVDLGYAVECLPC